LFVTGDIDVAIGDDRYNVRIARRIWPRTGDSRK